MEWCKKRFNSATAPKVLENYSPIVSFERNVNPKKMIEIIKKFKFRDTATVINVPADLAEEFQKLGFPSAFTKERSNNTLVFINNNEEYLDFLNNQLTKIEYDGVLWFAYPKGTSKIKTDVNRDTIRVTGEQFNMTTVTAVSINNTWSALRFRPLARVGK